MQNTNSTQYASMPVSNTAYTSCSITSAACAAMYTNITHSVQRASSFSTFLLNSYAHSAAAAAKNRTRVTGETSTQVNVMVSRTMAEITLVFKAGTSLSLLAA